MMLRLGNIDYSNCYPIHGPILEGPRPEWLAVVDGTPTELNRLLAAGSLDLAPGSSIELARHAREYGALRGLCIGSDGPVESIILATRRSPADLEARTVALPTASATSRVLLRILLETRLGVAPRWASFDQGAVDPLATAVRDGAGGSGEPGVDAALFIGDVALRRKPREGEAHVDLGAEWTTWTGLPFVYALWLVADDAVRQPETARLHEQLLAQRDSVSERLDALAERAGPRFGVTPGRLRSYWSRIRYDLDERMISGLMHFLSLATELGDAPPLPRLRLVP